MSQTFVLASHNTAKTAEIAAMFAQYGVTVVNYRELMPAQVFPAETTDDLVVNAHQKAAVIHAVLPDAWVLADDSALFLDAFPERFGVTTARELQALKLAGIAAENAYLTGLYTDETLPRGAHLTATYALISPTNDVLTVSARGGVALTTRPRGAHSRGFDEIICAENDKTFAEMPIAERVRYHHRGRAAQRLLTALEARGQQPALEKDMTVSHYWQQVVAKAQQGAPAGQKMPFFSLAPMEAVTDTIFRRVVAAAAAPDVFYTEFTNAHSMVHPKAKFSVQGRLLVAEQEQVPVVQLWGSDPELMAQAVQLLPAQGFSAIDLNMGCPDSTVIKNNSGSDLIRHPERAVALIQAAKTAGLPVSVKTRLGFNDINDYAEWLTIILKQDIAVLTIHLRTRKEMSKVPAHYDYIPAVLALRDALAPQTLIQINGDIADRAAGLALCQQYPGVDGVMIGRGVFDNPFAFSPSPAPRPLAEMLRLLRYQLDLFDEVCAQYGPRNFAALKRFFKIYLRGFAHASALRQMLMATKTTGDVRALLDEHERAMLAHTK